MSPFTEHTPTLDGYWRSVILYGDNTTSYKFALGQALLNLASAGRDRVRREELAVPFAQAVAAHLALEDKQSTSPTSKFLDAGRAYNRGDITHNEWIVATVRYGFRNVLQAFHIVNRKPIPRQFFVEDDRATGIILTDDLLSLREQVQFASLPSEVEARWRLVETAWGLKLPVSLVTVTYDEVTSGLVVDTRSGRRIAITAARDALNGYQQGRCFYCFNEITTTPGER